MEGLRATDLLGRSYVLELKTGERLHFYCQTCYFDELTGYDEEMNRRRLFISDISTAARKGKVYSKLIVDIVAV